jgi:DNA-directed RNA polymerase specialized sigma24 family protein
MDAALAGILALLVDEREERAKQSKPDVRTEVLLADVGLSVDEIVAVTRKNAGAVRKAIQRGRGR